MTEDAEALEAKNSGDATKPCDLPCPKCGSADIHRRFFEKGSRADSREYGVAPTPYMTGPGTYVWRATKDHIAHHCRCCQYDWATMPLQENRETKTVSS